MCPVAHVAGSLPLWYSGPVTDSRATAVTSRSNPTKRLSSPNSTPPTYPSSRPEL